MCPGCSGGGVEWPSATGGMVPASPSRLQCSRVPSTRHFAITNNSTLAASISLPWTKTTKSEGAQVTLAAQKGHRNPALHIANHIVASSLTEGDPLASYRDGQGIRTMTKSRFMKLCNDVWNIRDDSGSESAVQLHSSVPVSLRMWSRKWRDGSLTRF
jgi:hypothetical protein